MHHQGPDHRHDLVRVHRAGDRPLRRLQLAHRPRLHRLLRLEPPARHPRPHRDRARRPQRRHHHLPRPRLPLVLGGLRLHRLLQVGLERITCLIHIQGHL